MRALIAVASKHGSTHDIADAIAAELRAADVVVDLRDADEVTDLGPYQAVIIGSGVYAGSWLPNAKRFATHNHAALSTMPVWAFSSGPVGAEPQPHDDPKLLAAPLGDISPRDHQVFVGSLDLDKLTFAERLIVRLVKAPDGDYRDWNAIRAWARTIAAELQQPAVGAEA